MLNKLYGISAFDWELNKGIVTEENDAGVNTLKSKAENKINDITTDGYLIILENLCGEIFKSMRKRIDGPNTKPLLWQSMARRNSATGFHRCFAGWFSLMNLIPTYK